MIIALGIWAFIRSIPDTNPPDYYSNRAKISVSRLVTCEIGCPDLNNTGMISSYPNLRLALNRTDAKYFQKVEQNDCKKNDCMRDLFFNDTIDFTMSKDRALRMSDDFLASGADRHGQCHEGGCHSITFRVNRDAIYDMRIDYRRQAFAES